MQSEAPICAGSALILIEISNLVLDDAPAGAEWELMPGLTLSTRSDRLQNFLTENFKCSIGLIGSTSLLGSQHFVFAAFTADDIDQLLPGHRGQPEVTRMLLEIVLVWLRGLLRASWLVKDNCMSCEGAFAIYPTEGPPISASSNSLFELNITCNGRKSEQCHVTMTDLANIIALHDKVETVLADCRHEHGDAFVGKRSRIVRFFEFLQCARTSYSLPLRIAHYCSALEALFATSTAELSHRLSERIAHLAGTTRDERVAAYALAKEAYAMRSQVVHGAPLSKSSIPRVHSMCSEMDALLRTLLQRIIADPKMLALLSSSHEEMDEFFLHCLMGG